MAASNPRLSTHLRFRILHFSHSVDCPTNLLAGFGVPADTRPPLLSSRPAGQIRLDSVRNTGYCFLHERKEEVITSH
jgi:hypothetical protein